MDFHYENVNQFRYRNAITKPCVNSRALEIERGRLCGLSVEERACGYCHFIEDKKHFLFHCSVVKEQKYEKKWSVSFKFFSSFVIHRIEIYPIISS